jgi:hypothetical protein
MVTTPPWGVLIMFFFQSMKSILHGGRDGKFIFNDFTPQINFNLDITQLLGCIA